jgi:hypothetical protein
MKRIKQTFLACLVFLGVFYLGHSCRAYSSSLTKCLKCFGYWKGKYEQA